MPPKSNSAPAFKTQAKPAAPAEQLPAGSPPEAVEALGDPEAAVQEPEAPETPPAPPVAAPVEAVVLPHGLIYVRHPELIGCSFEGIQLSADAEGRVLVPSRALDVLAGHGFELVR